MKNGRKPASLEMRQKRLEDFERRASIARKNYEDNPTPANKVKLLNLQNSIRFERYLIKKLNCTQIVNTL